LNIERKNSGHEISMEIRKLGKYLYPVLFLQVMKFLLLLEIYEEYISTTNSQVNLIW